MARVFFFDKVLQKGAFPKTSKGPPIFAPSSTPAALEASVARLEKAVRECEQQASSMVAAGKSTFGHGFFGRVAVADYARFGALHAKHHEEQLRR